MNTLKNCITIKQIQNLKQKLFNKKKQEKLEKYQIIHNLIRKRFDNWFEYNKYSINIEILKEANKENSCVKIPINYLDIYYFCDFLKEKYPGYIINVSENREYIEIKF